VTLIGITPERLISAESLAEQRRLHAAPRGFGGRGDRWAGVVDEVARQHQCRTILDYGCGQGALGLVLRNAGWAVAEYDPAIEGKDGLPGPADMVVCTDVLEHVESDRIYRVAGHLAALTQRVLVVVVALVETDKRLSDGRSAHVLLRSVPWWRTLLEAHDFSLSHELVTSAKHWGAVWLGAGR
jgi:hypothetical protein